VLQAWFWHRCHGVKDGDGTNMQSTVMFVSFAVWLLDATCSGMSLGFHATWVAACINSVVH
jgi:hypothetical protein